MSVVKSMVNLLSYSIDFSPPPLNDIPGKSTKYVIYLLSHFHIFILPFLQGSQSPSQSSKDSRALGVHSSSPPFALKQSSEVGEAER